MSASTTGSTVSRGHLLAVLGVGFGIAVTIGNAIGAGILHGTRHRPAVAGRGAHAAKPRPLYMVPRMPPGQ